MSGCPVCGGGHESCQFGPASLYCIKTACGNPHHRPDPVAKLAAAGVMINASYLDAEPASVITGRRMRRSWPGCPPRSGTRCGIRNTATQRGSRLTRQPALIGLPRMLRNVAAASRG